MRIGHERNFHPIMVAHPGTSTQVCNAHTRTFGPSAPYRLGAWDATDMTGPPVALWWSGGKDSMLALAALRKTNTDVATLLVHTTDVGESVMHRVPTELLHQQACSLGLPLRELRLPEWPSNEEHDAAVAETVQALRAEGVTRVAFGDVNLADVRAYREQLFSRLGVDVLFPLWQQDTATLMRDLLAHGYHALVVCVDTEQLDASFCGRDVDERFLADLPSGIDPAGENGEYHTFVVDGPAFTEPVRLQRGERTQRGGRFHYVGVTPLDTGRE